MYLINPESFTQIGSAMSESIGLKQQDLPTPWKTLTGALSSDHDLIFKSLSLEKNWLTQPRKLLSTNVIIYIGALELRT